MITFKQFLLETSRTPRTKNIDVEDAIDLINEHCSAWAQILGDQGVGIWRGGSNAQGQASFGDSTKSVERVSANTENYFTLWHDNAPDWADYPKRSRSFVCSTSMDYAYSYGKAYLVVPYDNAIVAMMPEQDLFNSFKGVDPNDESAMLDMFNTFLSSSIERAGLDNPSTYEALVKVLKQLTREKVLSGDFDYDTEERYLKSIFNKTGAANFHEVFKKIFDPQDVKRFTAKNAALGRNDGEGFETYVQGKVVMLSGEALQDGTFDELVKKYGWNFDD